MDDRQRDVLQLAIANLHAVVDSIAASGNGTIRLRGWCTFNDETDSFRLQVDVSTGREVFR